MLVHQSIPRSVENFINEALNLAKDICGPHLISVYLFGGVAKGEFYENTSDVDMLYIISDECPINIIKTLEEKLKKLEFKHKILRMNSKDLLYYAFATKSALFKSHFVLRLRSIKHLNFSAMFHESEAFRLTFWKILNKPMLLFSPSRVTIRNIIKEAKILYGEDLIRRISPPTITNCEIAKIFITSWIMSIFGLISSIFSQSGTRFSLEAMKWYVLNVCSVLNGKPATVDSSLKYLSMRHLLPLPMLSISEKFVKLRKNYSHDIVFSIVIPLYLLVSYFKLIRHIHGMNRGRYNNDF